MTTIAGQSMLSGALPAHDDKTDAVTFEIKELSVPLEIGRQLNI